MGVPRLKERCAHHLDQQRFIGMLRGINDALTVTPANVLEEEPKLQWSDVEQLAPKCATICNFRLRMILAEYERKWAQLDNHFTAAAAKLVRLFPSTLLPQRLLDLKMASLRGIYVRAKRKINAVTLEDCHATISSYSQMRDPEPGPDAIIIIKQCTRHFDVFCSVMLAHNPVQGSRSTCKTRSPLGRKRSFLPLRLVSFPAKCIPC
jgi:hypothetical protein